MADRLNIVLITGEYPPMIGGVGDYTRQLARALIEREHRVTVVVAGTATGSRDAAEPIVMPLGEPWRGDSWRRVVDIVGQLRPDVAHIQYQTGAYGMHPGINLLPRRLRRLPVRGTPRPRIVVTAHDLRLPYLFPKAHPLRTWLTAKLFNDADALIVTNAEDEQRVQGRAESDRELYSPRTAIKTPVHVIPIGSNIAPQPPAGYHRDSWRQQLGLEFGTTLIAYFGLLSRTKGVLELLEALATLPPQFRLLIIGGAAPQPDDQRYAAEVNAAIAAHGLSPRVQITGPCAESDVSAHLLAADLAVLPFADGASYRRGSLLAALAHGIPTITTMPTTPLSPPLTDGVHALVVPRAESSMLHAAIERLAADESLRAKISAGGRTLTAYFGWPNIAAQHETVYHSL